MPTPSIYLLPTLLALALPHLTAAVPHQVFARATGTIVARQAVSSAQPQPSQLQVSYAVAPAQSSVVAESAVDVSVQPSVAQESAAATGGPQLVSYARRQDEVFSSAVLQVSDAGVQSVPPPAITTINVQPAVTYATVEPAVTSDVVEPAITSAALEPAITSAVIDPLQTFV